VLKNEECELLDCDAVSFGELLLRDADISPKYTFQSGYTKHFRKHNEILNAYLFKIMDEDLSMQGFRNKMNNVLF
jgi:hypothetical protein